MKKWEERLRLSFQISVRSTGTKMKNLCTGMEIPWLEPKDSTNIIYLVLIALFVPRPEQAAREWGSYDQIPPSFPLVQHTQICYSYYHLWWWHRYGDIELNDVLGGSSATHALSRSSCSREASSGMCLRVVSDPTSTSLCLARVKATLILRQSCSRVPTWRVREKKVKLGRKRCSYCLTFPVLLLRTKDTIMQSLSLPW